MLFTSIELYQMEPPESKPLGASQPGLFGLPALHTQRNLLATRTRIAQEEGVCWRGCPAASPAHAFLLGSRA